MHTSTAYTNTDKSVAEEIVYPPPAELDDVYAYLKQSDEEKTGDILSMFLLYLRTKILLLPISRKHSSL